MRTCCFVFMPTRLRDIQKFLVDLQGSAFGKQFKVTGIMHGLTKKANYVPGFPDQMKADLKTASDPGSNPYADRHSHSKKRRLVGPRPGEAGGHDEGAHRGRLALP